MILFPIKPLFISYPKCHFYDMGQTLLFWSNMSDTLLMTFYLLWSIKHIVFPKVYIAMLILFRLNSSQDSASNYFFSLVVLKYLCFLYFDLHFYKNAVFYTEWKLNIGKSKLHIRLHTFIWDTYQLITEARPTLMLHHLNYVFMTAVSSKKSI